MNDVGQRLQWQEEERGRKKRGRKGREGKEGWPSLTRPRHHTQDNQSFKTETENWNQSWWGLSGEEKRWAGACPIRNWMGEMAGQTWTEFFGRKQSWIASTVGKVIANLQETVLDPKLGAGGDSAQPQTNTSFKSSTARAQLLEVDDRPRMAPMKNGALISIGLGVLLSDGHHSIPGLLTPDCLSHFFSEYPHLSVSNLRNISVILKSYSLIPAWTHKSFTCVVQSLLYLAPGTPPIDFPLDLKQLSSLINFFNKRSIWISQISLGKITQNIFSLYPSLVEFF